MYNIVYVSRMYDYKLSMGISVSRYVSWHCL